MSAVDAVPEGPWNPGLSSSIPRRLQPEVTLFRAANATLDYPTASELADLSGIRAIELASLRPERLAVHELLVRVTADYSVPDGPNYADLGISLRTMVARLMEGHVTPELDAIRAAFEAERERARAILERELSARLFGAAGDTHGPKASGSVGTRGVGTGDGGRGGGGGDGGGDGGRGAKRSIGRRLFGALLGTRSTGKSAARQSSPPRASEPRELVALAEWRRALPTLDEPLERACLEALVRTVDAIVAHRGRLLASREAVSAIALALVGNTRGGEPIAELLGPIITRAAAQEGYRPLPAQPKPLIMNVKGASASGKSTIRPRQRELAGELGVPWEDFALISPDYWRKFLIDYDSLGEDRRYAAMLCGQELEIVDRKLDRYMAAKAARGEMSHLLIDRFRFDSFTLEKERTAESRLLTRFGHEIFLFFMVTPPVETVTRAWVRGQRTGRYKAVDDLLAHNVEAFTGMPALFLSWVTAEDRRVHFEFLDNDVPEGTLPLTAAFGWNERMTILDVTLMRAIDRYREVNVEASRPEDVLPRAEEAGQAGSAFVRRCAERIACIDFADRDTACVYARVEGGRLVWADEARIAGRADADVVRAVLDSLAPTAPAASDSDTLSPIDVEREAHFTVGRWASEARATERV